MFHNIGACLSPIAVCTCCCHNIEACCRVSESWSSPPRSVLRKGGVGQGWRQGGVKHEIPDPQVLADLTNRQITDI